MIIAAVPSQLQAGPTAQATTGKSSYSPRETVEVPLCASNQNEAVSVALFFGLPPPSGEKNPAEGQRLRVSGRQVLLEPPHRKTGL